MNSLTTTDRLKELLPQLFNTKKLEGNYYLRFQLTDEISGLIDLKYVQESLTVEGDRITAVPNLPDYAIGLMGSRNQVFIAIDLAHLVGLNPETVNLRQYQTIVVQTNVETNDRQSDNVNLFGFTVKQIEGISRILPERFTSDIENVSDILQPFIRSSVIQKSKNIASTVAEKQLFLLDIAGLIDRKINNT